MTNKETGSELKNNAVLNAIFARRSIRRFTDEAVPRDLLELVVEAGRYAPTAMNRQNISFTVLSQTERLEELAVAVGGALGRADYSFYQAPVLILLSVPHDSHMGRQDTGCALENMMLAAQSLGLGSVWINQFLDNCDEPLLRKELRLCGIEDDAVVHGALALGFPAETPAGIDRTEAVRYIGG